MLAEKLAAAFWPGPLTMVLPKVKGDSFCADGWRPNRWNPRPRHPFIQEVIRQCDFPWPLRVRILSNQISPTNAEHVHKSLGDKIKLIVDGGQSQVGIESTVLDLTVFPADDCCVPE